MSPVCVHASSVATITERLSSSLILLLQPAADNDAAFPDSKSPAAAEAVIQSPASQYTVGDESAANEAAADILAADAPHDPQQSTPGDQSAAVSDNLTADAIAERVSPVMLILCGVPGSGKSTFSAQLIAKGTPAG